MVLEAYSFTEEITSSCRSERASAFFLDALLSLCTLHSLHSKTQKETYLRETMRCEFNSSRQSAILLARESTASLVEMLLSACLKLFHFRDLLFSFTWIFSNREISSSDSLAQLEHMSLSVFASCERLPNSSRSFSELSTSVDNSVNLRVAVSHST
jgi:hypothetical protein